MLEASGVTATGYVDGTYSYLSRSPAEGPTQNTNAFALNQASLTVAYTPPTDFGVLVNAVVGTEACDGCYAPGYGSSGAHASTSSINLLQGYMQYVAGKTTIYAWQVPDLGRRRRSGTDRQCQRYPLAPVLV